MDISCASFLVVFLCIYIAYLFYKRKRFETRCHRLESAVKYALDRRQQSIETVKVKLDEVDVGLRQHIASMDFQVLLDSLQNGKVTALQVLRAYQEKALAAQEKTNCITQFILEADDWAKTLDEQFETNKGAAQRPPFFGIPFSIKECIGVKGYDQTRGYAQDIGRKCKEDSTIVEQIKELGGVPFVLTNVPRTLLSYSCTNPIYGTTSNAFREDRTSGGSSGGEGALIACGGSLIGIGTDVGGSIRYPCHFNGIAGIKPSHTRLSKSGVLNSVPGRQLADAAVGPMSKRIFACVYFLRHMWSKKYQYVKDPYSSPVDWDETQYSSRCKLRIGYYIDDGWFTPTPALQRAVLEAKVALEKCGHSLIEFRPSDVIQAFQNFSAAITVDGGEYLRRKLSKDLGGCDERSLTVWILRLPVWAKRIVAFLIEPIYPRIAIQLRAIPSTISELRSVYEQIENYRHKFVQKMHDEHIDAILCPIQVIPAPTHDVPAKLSAAGSYCSLFNILDFAAGTVNVTRVSEQDERHLNEEYPTSDPWYILAKKAAMDSVGLPVGVQVAAPPFKEETVLRVLKDIEETIASSDGHGRD